MSDADGWKTGPAFAADLAKLLKSRPTQDYPVGYSKPPVSGRFKPGQCGNPKGRPKKVERSHTDRQKFRDLVAMFNRETEIAIGGKKVKLTYIELIYYQAANQAAKGSFKHLCKIIELYNETLDLSVRLNPGPTNALNGVEQHLAETSAKIDPALHEQINVLRRRTRGL